MNKGRTIKGLVLAGGASRRMGRDKALISYDGKQSQIERTCSLLGRVCEAVFVSQRNEQNFEVPAGATSIFDSVSDIHGPLCGILSAMHEDPRADWLVLACDLPNLKESDLNHLIRAYSTLEKPHFTAYRSHYDSLPEPLCAIYPAGSAAELEKTAISTGKCCPRKLLINSDVFLINLLETNSLDNINTPEEFASFQSD